MHDKKTILVYEIGKISDLSQPSQFLHFLKIKVYAWACLIM